MATQQVEKLGLLVQDLNEELNASRRDVRSCPASSAAAEASPSRAAYPMGVVKAAPSSRFEPGTSPTGSCSGFESPPGPQKNPFFESDTDSGAEDSVEGLNPFEEDGGGEAAGTPTLSRRMPATTRTPARAGARKRTTPFVEVWCPQTGLLFPPAQPEKGGGSTSRAAECQKL